MKNSVKERRKLLNMTQGKFGDLIGVSRQTINAIEKEKFDLSVHTAFKMTEIFECAIEELFNFHANNPFYWLHKKRPEIKGLFFKMSNQTALVLLGKFFIVVFFQAKIKTNNHHH